jgi:dephospho-CoA kinase
MILVESESELRLARLIERDGMDEDTARQFLGAQAPLEVKRAAATHRLTNDGTLEELREKVRLLHSALSRGEKSFSA